MSVFSIHFYLRKDRESDSIVDSTYFFHGFIRFRFLVCELIAGESEDNKIIMRIGIPEGLEFFELWSKSTFGCGINHKNYLSCECLQLYIFTICFCYFDIVERGHMISV